MSDAYTYAEAVDAAAVTLKSALDAWRAAVVAETAGNVAMRLLSRPSVTASLCASGLDEDIIPSDGGYLRSVERQTFTVKTAKYLGISS